MPTLKCVTLGCKVNQYETQYVREAFEALGYREAAEGEPVDLCLVNTCTVTATSDVKSRKAIRRLSREHPRAKIVVMGCYAARAAEQLAAMPGVVEVLADKRRLPELLARFGAVHPPRGISRFGTRHRAYVKVQDGCPMDCAYCIIPRVRPRVSSRPMPEVLDEVRRLVRAGYREVVLTGIHLGFYGCESHTNLGFPVSGRQEAPAVVGPPDAMGIPGTVRGESPGLHRAGGLAGAGATELPPPRGLSRGAHLGLAGLPQASAGQPGMRLVELLRRLGELPGQFRLRLSSLEAAEVLEELVELMAARPDRICPHLHVPLQSGSDRVLGRMRRRWPVGMVIERCGMLAARLDHPALTTDVIVGFPGETEEDFEATCRVVEQVGFSKLHVFPFSPREGTPAAAMSDRVPADVVRRRVRQLDRLGRELRRRYMEQLLGRRLCVLAEEPLDQKPTCGGQFWLRGTADRYVPVVFRGPREWCGRLIEVRVDEVSLPRPAAQSSPSTPGKTSRSPGERAGMHLTLFPAE